MQFLMEVNYLFFNMVIITDQQNSSFKYLEKGLTNFFPGVEGQK